LTITCPGLTTDSATAVTLQACAHAVSDLAGHRLTAMIEPFISRREDGRLRNDLSPEAMMRAISVAMRCPGQAGLQKA
jgi:hypothetical protein